MFDHTYKLKWFPIRAQLSKMVISSVESLHVKRKAHMTIFKTWLGRSEWQFCSRIIIKETNLDPCLIFSWLAFQINKKKFIAYLYMNVFGYIIIYMSCFTLNTYQLIHMSWDWDKLKTFHVVTQNKFSATMLDWCS